MRKLLMFLTAMLMCAINMTAQLTSVSGTVLSAEDDEPLSEPQCA